MKKTTLISGFALLALSQPCHAFSQYHASEFRSVAPFWGSHAFNRLGQFSGTDSSGNLALWSSQGGTQTIGKPFGLSVSQGSQQALSENGDAAVVAGGLVTSNLFSYNHTRGWEVLPYTMDTDVIEMQFWGYSNTEMIAVQGTRDHALSRIYRYERNEDGWQLHSIPGTNGYGEICSMDREGNTYYGRGSQIVKPFIWKADGTVVQLSMGAYVNGQVWPLGSDATGRVYGSAWSSSLGGSIVTWDTWTSQPSVLISGVSAGPHLSFVNDFGELMLTQQSGSNLYTALWSLNSGIVNLQSLLVNGNQFNPITGSYSFNNIGEVEGFTYGGDQTPLLMRPVPEPSTLVLVGGGIAMFVIRRRRRK